MQACVRCFNDIGFLCKLVRLYFLPFRLSDARVLRVRRKVDLFFVRLMRFWIALSLCCLTPLCCLAK